MSGALRTSPELSEALRSCPELSGAVRSPEAPHRSPSSRAPPSQRLEERLTSSNRRTQHSFRRG
eukprot:11807428-Alexandrium_andersonii.AAC.1